MKGKIDIWAISSNFDDLKEEVKRQNHNHQDFKVIYLKILLAIQIIKKHLINVKIFHGL